MLTLSNQQTNIIGHCCHITLKFHYKIIYILVKCFCLGIDVIVVTTAPCYQILCNTYKAFKQNVHGLHQCLFINSETPGAPRGPLVAKNENRDTIALSWQPPLDDGGSPITGYIVDKLDIQRGGWVRAARVPGNTTAHTLSGLMVGHDYNFRVYAENKAGVGQPLDLKTPVKAKSAFSEYLVLRFCTK